MGYWLKIVDKDGVALYINLDKVERIVNTSNEIRIVFGLIVYEYSKPLSNAANLARDSLVFKKAEIQSLTVLSEQAMVMELPYLMPSEDGESDEEGE